MGVPGMYCSGWARRGPSGIIGTNIPDARSVVASIVEDARCELRPHKRGWLLAQVFHGRVEPGANPPNREMIFLLPCPALMATWQHRWIQTDKAGYGSMCMDASAMFPLMDTLISFLRYLFRAPLCMGNRSGHLDLKKHKEGPVALSRLVSERSGVPIRSADGVQDGSSTSMVYRGAVDWEGYKRIDEEEVARGCLKGKPREKIVDVAEMLDIANGRQRT